MSRVATDWAWSLEVKPATLKLILLSMADRADEEHCCFPSIQRLVKDTSLNEKTVQSGINKLIEMGVVSDTGERKGPTRRVRVLRLNVSQKQTQNRNDSKIGNVTENGVLNDPEIGMLNDPEIGVQNQSLEPVIEPNNNAPASADASSPIASRTDRKKVQSKTAQAKSKQSAEKAFLSNLINRGVEEALATEWIAVRKTKRMPMSVGAIDLLEREAGKAGVTLTDALVNCVLRGWGGFKAEWLASDQSRNTAQPQRGRPQGQAPSLPDFNFED